MTENVKRDDGGQQQPALPRLYGWDAIYGPGAAGIGEPEPPEAQEPDDPMTSIREQIGQALARQVAARNEAA